MGRWSGNGDRGERHRKVRVWILALTTCLTLDPHPRLFSTSPPSHLPHAASAPETVLLHGAAFTPALEKHEAHRRPCAGDHRPPLCWCSISDVSCGETIITQVLPCGQHVSINPVLCLIGVTRTEWVSVAVELREASVMASWSGQRASSVLRTLSDTIHSAHRHWVATSHCSVSADMCAPVMVKRHIWTWSSETVKETSHLFCAAVGGVREQLHLQQNWPKWLTVFSCLCISGLLQYQCHAESCRHVTVPKTTWPVTYQICPPHLSLKPQCCPRWPGSACKRYCSLPAFSFQEANNTCRASHFLRLSLLVLVLIVVVGSCVYAQSLYLPLCVLFPIQGKQRTSCSDF